MSPVHELWTAGAVLRLSTGRVELEVAGRELPAPRRVDPVMLSTEFL